MPSAAIRSGSPDTICAAIEAATARLAETGISTPRLDAELLLAHACGTDRTGLYAKWRRPLPPQVCQRFSALLQRRLEREPLQYIRGSQEFWSLEFAVSPEVLIPRPETELLVELVLKVITEREPHPSRRSQEMGPPQGERSLILHMSQDTARPEELPSTGRVSKGARWEKAAFLPESGDRFAICDVGTGSGCIAVALAHELPGSDIWAVDISAAALAVARANARRYEVADQIHFLQGDLLGAAAEACFDIIVSNPPYVAPDVLSAVAPELHYEPRQALDGGNAGLDLVARLVAQAPACLTPTGCLILEIGADQGTAVATLAHNAGFGRVAIEPDGAGLPRALFARR